MKTTDPCADLGWQLAMAVLQSPLYAKNADVRDLVDNILAAHRFRQKSPCTEGEQKPG